MKERPPGLEAGQPLTLDLAVQGVLYPMVQQAYLKASNTGAADWFGFSVAISGDTPVVGALNEASNATGVNGNQGTIRPIRPGRPTSITLQKLICQLFSRDFE